MTTYSGSISGSLIINGSHSWTITDADLQSLLDWATVSFATDPLVPLSNAAALIAWQQWMLDQTRSVVTTYKRKQQREALIPIPPIVFT